jgi:hypothetical protein
VSVKKILSWVAGVLAALYVGFLTFLFFAQTSIIYPGGKNPVDPSPPTAPGLEVLVLSTPVGQVEALFLPTTANADSRIGEESGRRTGVASLGRRCRARAGSPNGSTRRRRMPAVLGEVGDNFALAQIVADALRAVHSFGWFILPTSALPYFPRMRIIGCEGTRSEECIAWDWGDMRPGGHKDRHRP